MPSPAELQLLAAKIESVYGTDPVPTVGANLIPPLNDSLSHVVSRTAVPRKIADATFGRIQPYSILPVATVKFTYELRGNLAIQSGLIGDAVEIDHLLQACNLDPTYGAGAFVTYIPKVYPASVGPSITLYYWAAGQLHKITGAKGNIDRIRAEPEKPILIDFSFSGLYNNPGETALPETGHVWDDTLPPQLQALVLSDGAAITSLPAMMAEFALGNTVTQRTFAAPSTPGQASGVKGFIVTGRNSTGKVEFEAGAGSGSGIHPMYAQSQGGDVNVELKAGGEDGNRVYCVFTGHITNHAYGNRNGVRTNVLDLDINRKTLTAGTNEFYLRFA